MKCILKKCTECEEGAFRLYCGLRGIPVTLESICRIDQHIGKLKQRIIDLAELSASIAKQQEELNIK